jgi:excisionase family DNA binding protein
VIQTSEPYDAIRRSRERYEAQQAGLPLPRLPFTTANVPAPREPLEVMTVQEIAAELGVSKMTVYRLIESRTLVGFRVGRSIRVKVSEYQRFIGGLS